MSGDRSIRRTKTDEPAASRRLADGSSGICSERGKRTSVRDRGGRSSGRTARYSFRIFRVQRRSEVGMLCGRAHSELVHICFPDDDRACFFQFFDTGRRIRGNEILKHLRSAGHFLSRKQEIVFYGHRHTEKRKIRRTFLKCPVCNHFVYFARFFERFFLPKSEVGMDLIFMLVYIFENSANRFFRGHFLLPDFLCQFKCCEGKDLFSIHRRTSYTILGTLNMPSFACGA